MKNKLKIYLFSYRYKDAQYSLEIPAYSLDEAKGKLSMMSFAKYDGELVAKIPSLPSIGIFVRIITWFRNRIY